MDSQAKPVYQSKTLIAALMIPLLPFIPGPVGEWVRANQEAAFGLVGLLVGGLRFYTDRAITFTKQF